MVFSQFILIIHPRTEKKFKKREMTTNRNILHELQKIITNAFIEAQTNQCLLNRDNKKLIVNYDWDDAYDVKRRYQESFMCKRALDNPKLNKIEKAIACTPYAQGDVKNNATIRLREKCRLNRQDVEKIQTRIETDLKKFLQQKDDIKTDDVCDSTVKTIVKSLNHVCMNEALQNIIDMNALKKDVKRENAYIVGIKENIAHGVALERFMANPSFSRSTEQLCEWYTDKLYHSGPRHRKWYERAGHVKHLPWIYVLIFTIFVLIMAVIAVYAKRNGSKKNFFN